MDQTVSSVGGMVFIDFADSKNPIVEKLAFDFERQAMYSASSIAVLVDFNQLPLFQSFDGFLERTFLDAGIPNDFRVSRPAVSFAAGAADQVRIQFELRGIHGYSENLIGQTEEFSAWRLILSH